MCESCKKPFYITTPIYYPSSNLHIGHAYCSTAADSMARFKKLTGYDVYFLTGTDEHGQKIERKAKEQGVTPKEYVDKIVAGIKDLWKLMDIDYSDFIRTTDDRHVKCVQKIFKQLYDQGDIYKSEYEGWYCTPCESFWTELQLKDGCCPDCGRPVEKTREESYFFRLQKYAEWLIQYIEEHPDFIQPASRANEMLNNFLRPGLEDLCVSRTSIKWGIPVTFDEKHTVYVWIDALHGGCAGADGRCGGVVFLLDVRGCVRGAGCAADALPRWIRLDCQRADCQADTVELRVLLPSARNAGAPRRTQRDCPQGRRLV